MTKPLDTTAGRTQEMTAPRPSLGIGACSALVVGSIIGSGFYLSPAALAPYGAAALVGWIGMAIAAMCLGLVFARLAGVKPATGGPYAYSRMVFGPFAGFLVAWAYWISIWASLPAIATVFAGYLGVFFPKLQHVPGGFTVVSLAAMWLVALINMFGVKSAGRFQVVTDGLKLVPFIAIALLGLFWSREPDTRQSERPLPAWPHFRNRAADDVCLSRHRIGDGTDRRCRRPEADDPAGDDPRHALLRADLHPGYAGVAGGRAAGRGPTGAVGKKRGAADPSAAPGRFKQSTYADRSSGTRRLQRHGRQKTISCSEIRHLPYFPDQPWGLASTRPRREFPFSINTLRHGCAALPGIGEMPCK